MKKLVLSVFLCLLVLCLTLPCFAFFPVPSESYFSAENYQEYKKELRGRELPDNFISYDRVSFLGEFNDFVSEDLKSNSYRYYLTTSDDQELILAFNTFAEYDNLIVVTDTVVGLDVNFISENRLKLNMELIRWKTNIEVEGSDILWFCVRDPIIDGHYYEVEYYYNRQGELDHITLPFNGEYCTIKTDFSKCAPDSWIGKLLSIHFKTARETAIELKTRFWGNGEKSWEQPLSICLSAISGAVLAGVGAWLITFLVMRKKRGALAPVPAMAGAPAGEVSAGSDVDVSAAPSGAAPAAPDN